MSEVAIVIESGLKLRKALIDAAFEANLPVALWQLPNDTSFHLIINLSAIPSKKRIDLEELGSGFAFSPFNNPDGNDTFFLKSDIHFVFKADDSWDNLSENQISPFNQILANKVNAAIAKSADSQEATTKEQFVNSVENAIAAIQQGDFQKVVLSRTKKITVSSKFDLLTYFDKLCHAYPSAFISVVSLPHLQEIWIGATPEILVLQDEKGFFSTMALAGTQSAYDANGNLLKPIEALWSQKEIEEQALVSRYIINCFKKVRVREYEEIGPKSVIAGNLIHLRTEFKVDTKAINFPQLATVMLDLLHPTSAVCGMPKAAATQFILTNELYPRTFYSGYLGPVNIQKQTQLFVNLRSSKLSNGVLTLFAGCGITADSNPEKEWIETEMKCQTLSRVFNEVN